MRPATGITGTVRTMIPIGAGLSSSAALDDGRRLRRVRRRTHRTGAVTGGWVVRAVAGASRVE